MAISFIDDNYKLSECFVKRDYSKIEKKIFDNKEDLTFYIEDNNQLFGFNIRPNIPMTKLYESPFYVVRFVFANVNTLHDRKQEENMRILLQELDKKMNETKGYYNLRIPTHMVDLIRTMNTAIRDTIFCGGTVEELIANKSVSVPVKEGLKIFWGTEEYVGKHKETLAQMTHESFLSYQGQYHISTKTEEKAGEIYKNWIESSLNNLGNELVVCAEYDGHPIGFVTFGEQEEAVEGILSAVDSKYRAYGAYKAMISFGINYAYEKNKIFVSSTQFDNYIVQGTWNSLGLKPFYSIYNFHVDRR